MSVIVWEQKKKKITATSARIAQILIWVILHVFCISFIRMRFSSSDKKNCFKVGISIWHQIYQLSKFLIEQNWLTIKFQFVSRFSFIFALFRSNFNFYFYFYFNFTFEKQTRILFLFFITLFMIIFIITIIFIIIVTVFLLLLLLLFWF